MKSTNLRAILASSVALAALGISQSATSQTAAPSADCTQLQAMLNQKLQQRAMDYSPTMTAQQAVEVNANSYAIVQTRIPTPANTGNPLLDKAVAWLTAELDVYFRNQLVDIINPALNSMRQASQSQLSSPLAKAGLSPCVSTVLRGPLGKQSQGLSISLTCPNGSNIFGGTGLLNINATSVGTGSSVSTGIGLGGTASVVNVPGSGAPVVVTPAPITLAPAGTATGAACTGFSGFITRITGNTCN